MINQIINRVINPTPFLSPLLLSYLKTADGVEGEGNTKTAKISQVRWDGERFEFFPSPFARPQPRPSLHAVACVVGVSPTQGVHPALGHRHSRRSCALFCSLLCCCNIFSICQDVIIYTWFNTFAKNYGRHSNGNEF